MTKYFVTISNCKHCNFYFVSMDGMECKHPYWADKPAYVNMIISHDIAVSKECPLRKEALKITYKLKEV